MLWICPAIVGVLISLGLAADARQQPPAGPPPKAMDPAVKKDGWWIRIAPDPAAQVITWQITRTDKPGEKPAIVTWRRGNDPDNFDLPENVRLADGLSLSVTGTPAGASSSFCLFYAAHGVRQLSLPVSRPVALDTSQRDSTCRP